MKTRTDHRAARPASLRVGAGLSTRRSGLAAVEEALGDALSPLRGAIPDLTFLFVAPQFQEELDELVESANASLGGARCFAASPEASSAAPPGAGAAPPAAEGGAPAPAVAVLRLR